MTEKLKPCPFCGGTGMYVTYQQSVYIRCRKCNSTSDDYKTTEEAENAWNKRTNPWHTGNPTEDGWYLTCCEVLYNGKIEEVYEIVRWACGQWGIRRCDRKIVAWQKIEPYRG